ncbi:MAG TPA: isochorismatase family cysteine hydrolase [Polyangiaceae bacterium]|nr:isochorismatase family cysteine hydrolase [Polyangiaceae bacterium]
MNAPIVDPETTALLVMDFQTVVVEMIATDKEARLARAAALVEGARKAGMRIIYVVVGFRAGYPEVSPRNRWFAELRGSGRFVEGSAGTEVHAALAPNPGDVVVTKHRVSAFAGTDLDMTLRANGIDTLVLAGLATSGVVLSTVRHAADADYRLVVVEDCCGDRDAEVHRMLVEKVFPRQATVINSSELLAALGTADPADGTGPPRGTRLP